MSACGADQSRLSAIVNGFINHCTKALSVKDITSALHLVSMNDILLKLNDPFTLSRGAVANDIDWVALPNCLRKQVSLAFTSAENMFKIQHQHNCLTVILLGYQWKPGFGPTAYGRNWELLHTPPRFGPAPRRCSGILFCLVCSPPLVFDDPVYTKSIWAIGRRTSYRRIRFGGPDGPIHLKSEAPQ